jgi:hypothetical protein
MMTLLTDLKIAGTLQAHNHYPDTKLLHKIKKFDQYLTQSSLEAERPIKKRGKYKWTPITFPCNKELSIPEKSS